MLNGPGDRELGGQVKTFTLYAQGFKQREADLYSLKVNEKIIV